MDAAEKAKELERNEVYLEGLQNERIMVEGQGDTDRVKQIDAEIAGAKKAIRSLSSKREKATDDVRE